MGTDVGLWEREKQALIQGTQMADGECHLTHRRKFVIWKFQSQLAGACFLVEPHSQSGNNAQYYAKGIRVRLLVGSESFRIENFLDILEQRVSQCHPGKRIIIHRR